MVFLELPLQPQSSSQWEFGENVLVLRAKVTAAYASATAMTNPTIMY